MCTKQRILGDILMFNVRKIQMTCNKTDSMTHFIQVPLAVMKLPFHVKYQSQLHNKSLNLQLELHDFKCKVIHEG